MRADVKVGFDDRTGKASDHLEPDQWEGQNFGKHHLAVLAWFFWQTLFWVVRAWTLNGLGAEPLGQLADLKLKADKVKQHVAVMLHANGINSPKKSSYPQV